MAGFGSLAPSYDPMTGLAITQPEEIPADTPIVPNQQGPLSKVLHRLTGTQFGEPRTQLWPEAVARSAFTLPHDVYTGEVPTYETDPVTGDRNFSHQLMERSQDLAGVAGGGMLFGSLARPAAETGVRVLGRQVLQDSAPAGGPLAALEQGKALAVERRNKGWNTGKSAAGWDWKRPDPEAGSFDRLYQEARGRYKAQEETPPSPLMTPDDHAFMRSGNFYEDAATPGAPISALEKSSPRNVNWENIGAAERSLSPEASRALDSWVGGTTDTMAAMEKGYHPGWGIFNRDALQKNPAALNEISAKFQPLRDQLRAEHGNTVTLHRYRGDVPEDAKPHDLLSFTADREIAEGLSGARKEVPLVPESEIAAREAELEKTGRTQISKNTWLEKKSDRIGNGKEEVPVDYIAIMRPDGMVTDTPSVREYFADENGWRQQVLDKRKTALSKVNSYQIPVDDIVGATNPFGQKEFIVRNTKGLFEDSATAGAPIAALEHPAQPYHGLLDQPAGGAYDAPHVAETAAAREAAPAPSGSPGGDVAGGAGGGDARLYEAQAAAARRAGAVTPLEGLPSKAMKIGDEHFVPGPIESVHQVASDYMAGRDLPSYHKIPTKYHPLDEEHSKAIARAFDEMPHTPDDPATKASYDALIKETLDQYRAVKASGLKVEPIPADMPDPYAANPRLAAKDVADNNHLWFFPTEGGFGSGAAAETTHPMLTKTGEKLGDRELLANDMFRIVHDYFGHLKEGHGFRAGGEDNAWRSHASMYSDLARPAMTTETRGQNSWVNYGPHGDKNRKASAADTVYADQKVGLMPEWTMRDRGSPEPTIAYHGSPYSFDKFDPAKIGAGEGNQAYGHGLYFAGHEPVSEWYRHQLAARRDEPILKKHGLDSEDGANIGMRLASNRGDIGKTVAQLEKEIADLPHKEATDASGFPLYLDAASANMAKRREGMINFLKDPKRNPGHMYQVAIDAAPDKFLDWDKPLKEMSPEVRKILADEWLAHPEAHANQTGAQIYESSRVAPGEYRDPYSASKRLLDAGIPGIKYLDQMSRSLGGGTHNYVAFGAPRLLKRYAAPGMIGAGGFGSLARKDEQ